MCAVIPWSAPVPRYFGWWFVHGVACWLHVSGRMECSALPAIYTLAAWVVSSGHQAGGKHQDTLEYSLVPVSLLLAWRLLLSAEVEVDILLGNPIQLVFKQGVSQESADVSFVDCGETWDPVPSTYAPPTWFA